jgi:hypothetical protein
MPIVKLHYYKSSGKYYSDGEFEAKGTYLWDFVKEVKEMKAEGKLPGLVDGAVEFIIHILPRNEDDCVPHIIPLERVSGEH